MTRCVNLRWSILGQFWSCSSEYVCVVFNSLSGSKHMRIHPKFGYVDQRMCCAKIKECVLRHERNVFAEIKVMCCRHTSRDKTHSLDLGQHTSFISQNTFLDFLRNTFPLGESSYVYCTHHGTRVVGKIH